MPFAEGGGGVAVLPEDFRQAGGIVGDHAGVAGEPGAHFNDDAGTDAMVVAAGEQGGTGGRTEGSGMEGIETQPMAGKSVHSGGGYSPAKGAGMTEADVIQDDDQNIWGARRGLDLLRKIGFGIPQRCPDFAFKSRFGNR